MTGTKQHTTKIVLTGPESSGKTALAEALALLLSAPCVPEFARYFAAHLGRPYQRADLQAIGRGQQAWEQWHAAAEPPILVCDTDWTVLHVWEHYRFGAPPDGVWEWKKGYANPQPADLYLLCAPDFPWQPDPLREHPEERQILFAWYERLLIETGARYTILAGSHEQRLHTVLGELQKLS
ncbi:MAG: ATP-binding protein [Saprospiraceae bacterium]|jgi:nicotinamide riboside kinase|nr:ATP-binding protein [Saprospiraceae bacterium]